MDTNERITGIKINQISKIKRQNQAQKSKPKLKNIFELWVRFCPAIAGPRCGGALCSLLLLITHYKPYTLYLIPDTNTALVTSAPAGPKYQPQLIAKEIKKG